MVVARATRSLKPLEQEQAVAPRRQSHGPSTSLLDVQRAAGNQATCELLRQGGASEPAVARDAARTPEELCPRSRPPTPPAERPGRPAAAIEAKCFPTGKEILAGTTVRRTRAISPAAVAVQRWDWPWAKKEKETKKMAGQEARLPTGSDVGVAFAKPAVVTGATAITSGTMLGVGATGAAAAGTLAAGALVAGDALMGLRNGYRRQEESGRFGDAGGARLGQEKVGESKIGLGNAALGLAGSSVTEAAVHGGQLATGGGLNMGVHASNAAQWAGHTATGVAATSMSIAAGIVNMAEGGYKMWQSLKKTGKLDANKIFSAAGKRWGERVRNRETWKKAFHALKIAAGVLGIVAGGLMLASNPVGWAIGISAAVIGAGMGIGKAIQKGKQASDRKAKMTDPALSAPAAVSEPWAKNAAAMAAGGASKEEQAQRKKLKDHADHVARLAGTNAAIAGEIRANLDFDKASQARLAEVMHKQLKTTLQVPYEASFAIGAERWSIRAGEDEFAARDAFVMLDVLGIKEEQAKSDSGQELIEKTMSVNEAV
jgi:hypothetical protein